MMKLLIVVVGTNHSGTSAVAKLLLDNGAASWDLTTKDGLNVAYGVYIYHVDAPGIGTHIDKFAIIK